jgi:hypothetical protein
MRKILLLLTGLLIIAGSYASVNVIKPKEPTLNAAEVFFPVGNTGKQISLLELSQISVKDFETLTGKKLNFLDRIGFKKAQKKVRNQIAPDGTITSKKFERYIKKAGETGFHLGGFALGFFVGLIGVLIAYLIKDDYKSNRVKWAWIGFGIAVVLNIILIIAVFNSVD